MLFIMEEDLELNIIIEIVECILRKDLSIIINFTQQAVKVFLQFMLIRIVQDTLFQKQVL